MGRGARSGLIVLASIVGLLLGYVATRIAGTTIVWLEGPDSRPFWLSLRVASMATVIAATAGIAGGYALAKGRVRGRDLIEAVASLPIILPPTVLGYYLLVTLDTTSASGRVLHSLLGRDLLFNVTACVIAGSVAAFPFCLRAARAAIESVDPRLEQAAKAMGLSSWRIAWQVTLPLARRGLAVGVTLGFVRSIGEYGATLMVGGDIPGSTRTMSIAVTDAQTTHDREMLVRILVGMAAIALLCISRLGGTRH
jgi:molybdate transport system permease protein